MLFVDFLNKDIVLFGPLDFFPLDGFPFYQCSNPMFQN